MEIRGDRTDKGFERQVDFKGATLPDGRSIEGILDENDKLKSDIDMLKQETKEATSVLTILIPCRWLRIIVELALIISTIVGVLMLFF